MTDNKPQPPVASRGTALENPVFDSHESVDHESVTLHPVVRHHWVLAGIVVLLTIAAGIVVPNWASATRHEPSSASYTTLALELPPLPASEADPAIAALAAGSSEPDWRIVRVRAGQSLSDIFAEQGLPASDLQRALDSQNDASVLRRIRPNDEFEFDITADGTLRAMRFERSEADRVTLEFDANGVHESVASRAIERRTQIAHGVITRSLYEAGAQAGISDQLIGRLAEAFAYDIDFAQDLRVGDSFSVVYDEDYCDGERLDRAKGEVLAATFINQGKRYTAIRYTNAQGESMFYSEDGRPLRKSFLRTPVEFTRISSTFSAGRMHPVLGYMRAHKGVDYAAPSGTPIRAAGDGKITFRGRQGGYGNVVIIQHNGKYSTLYGHMSRFANVKVGQRVAQGQTIGFVGMTGLATGPHLHYEFRVGGTHRDPLTVTLPKPEPLPKTEFAKFHQAIAPMLAKLQMIDDVRLASRGPRANRGG
ncbi:MAG: peptidoglycan DD-metalloendopeptidase family protein [Dokdonella sp.]